MTTTEPTAWTGCYEGNWKGFITDASHQHPAKFSKSLIERIFDHLLLTGRLRRGDVVGDPFGGVCTGGLVAAYRGLNWLGVELEPRFVALGHENIRLHQRHLGSLNCPSPILYQGDSRRFHEIISIDAACIVSSPPYADSVNSSKSGIDWDKAKRPERWTRGDKRNACQASADHVMKYGKTEGQVGALAALKLDSVVSSPLYGETLSHGGGPDTDKDLLQGGPSLMGIKKGYGKSTGQVGEAGGETYWWAMFKIILSCRIALRPGGVICLVVKDYIKAGSRVRLCDDTARLLEHCGFVMEERIHAMLVSESVHEDLFDGAQVKKTERKSFFRRLYEAKIPAGDERRIDYEEILIARAPS